MSERYRVDFDSLPWEVVMVGVRQKVVTQGGRRLRWVEYAQEMPLHWCERGHVGQILAGRLQVQFARETLVFGPGEGVMIPSGPEHAHAAAALTPTVLAVFAEDA